MPTICLITTGQPSTNPRLVKEADALTEFGYEVHAICAHWANWATEMDKELLRARMWKCRYVGGHPKTGMSRYYWTRLRHGLSRQSISMWYGNSVVKNLALCRVSLELQHAAKNTPADLYIAHNLGALPAAVAAARENSAHVGFDAEDFHSGEHLSGTVSAWDQLVNYFESNYLPECDYITAASHGIADAYAAKYGIATPVTILNVFPLSQSPSEFRASDPRNPFTLYWFGQTIGASRGLEDVIQAMGILQEHEIELHLRGSWSPGYRDLLLRLATLSRVRSDQIIYHTPGPADEMIRLASEYEVGLALEHPVSDNHDICLSNKIFTYLLAGNAVIATATKGQQALIEKLGSAGFCYQPGNVLALAKQLEMWFKDRKCLEKARRAAWDSGIREYNWDIEKKKFLKIVETILIG